MRGRLILYNALIAVLAILTLPWVIYQLVFVKKRRQGLSQRLGSSLPESRRTIWCHAVSVGEVKAIGPMLLQLEDDERAKGRIVLSTVTLTGQETARRDCGFVSRIVYFPLDLPFAVNRAIRRMDPKIFITAETEIWPNFFNACFNRRIPVVVVNGRISDSSFSRYMRFRWFFGPVLENVAMFLMQSEEDARRIVEMGAAPEKVRVTGNMKYDRAPDPVSLPEPVKRWAESGFLVVAGSTHATEEEQVLDAAQEIGRAQGILTALVPRHPERFDEVEELLKKRNLSFTRYSRIQKGDNVTGQILLVDAMGVLDGFYALADAAFVGGSLVPVGGHNLLEPAMHGVPVLTGPHLHNFREIAEDLISSGGCLIVGNGQELGSAIDELLADPEKERAMACAAKNASGEMKGASEENADFILGIVGAGV